ncbi:MAG: hypothetical protein J5707_05230, partial [Candidatus Methanomethylophilus sp.]|nr:hypothetical protein [Methanomethylophilus sp.]
MNHLFNITKKELRELLTPGTIVSILVVVIMFTALGSAMSGESESEAAPKEIGIVFPEAQLEDPLVAGHTLKEILQAAYNSTYGVNTFDHIHIMDVDPTDQKAIADNVKSNGYAVALVIPSNLKANIDSKTQTNVQMYYSYVQTGIFGAASSMTGTVFMDSVNQILEYYIIPSDPEFTMS